MSAPRSTSAAEARPALVPGRWRATFVHPVPPALDIFFQHLAEGRILGLRCQSCGKVLAQPRVRCVFCHARPGDDLIEVGPVGTIRSACVVMTPMAGLDATPGGMACVQPNGADSALLVRLHGIEMLSDPELTAVVGQTCRLRVPIRPSRTWADLEFELSGRET